MNLCVKDNYKSQAAFILIHSGNLITITEHSMNCNYCEMSASHVKVSHYNDCHIQYIGKM